MINKKKIIITIIIILGLCLIPKIINIIDLSLANQTSQVFQIEQKELDLSNVDISCNIPIPQDIKDKMVAEREAQRQKEIEEQRKIEEQKKVEIANTKKKQEKITNRSGVSQERTESVETQSSEGWIKFIATGYCPCSKCCGKNTGITAMGTKARANHTVAMPKGYNFGTQIQIKGMGTYTVEDRGGAIKGNKIDIFFNTHQEALDFGRRTVYLKVL